MDYCTQCGSELGDGRYCTNCGHPRPSRDLDDLDDLDGWRTDTAERPASAPAGPPPGAPPPAWTPPPPVRFPLYADETDDADAAAQTRIASPVPSQPEYAAPGHAAARRRRPWGLWFAIAAILVLLAVIGVVLLRDNDNDNGNDKDRSDEPSATTSDPTSSGAGAVSNLAADATVTVPATADPGTDVDGRPVTFDAENMLDGVPETAWRMPGDGTGEEVVVTLPRQSHLRSVGLINGYAKKAADRDWYHGNRRIEQVQWVFDDGTTVDQTLDDTTGVQSVDVDVTTTTITLRLVAVSDPGTGPDRRDNTAISDLSLVGGV